MTPKDHMVWHSVWFGSLIVQNQKWNDKTYFLSSSTTGLPQQSQSEWLFGFLLSYLNLDVLLIGENFSLSWCTTRPAKHLTIHLYTAMSWDRSNWIRSNKSHAKVSITFYTKALVSNFFSGIKYFHQSLQHNVFDFYPL